MASDTGCLQDAKMKRETETMDLLEQKAALDVRLTTLSDNINVCNAVLDDLQALNKLLVNKSLEDLYLKPQKETEEPLPKTSP